jgi:hypothetical protein
MSQSTPLKARVTYKQTLAVFLKNAEQGTLNTCAWKDLRTLQTALLPEYYVTAPINVYIV